MRVRISVRVSVRVRIGLEEVFVFDSKIENRDSAVEAVELVSESRAL